MRELNFTVCVDSVTPLSVQDGGFQCEYNSTKAIFILDSQLVQQLNEIGGTQLWSVEAINGEGGFGVYPLELQDDKLEFVLPTEITLPKTTAELQLVVTIIDNDYTMLKKQYFKAVKIKFSHSVSSLVDSNEYDRYARNLVGAMEVAVTSMESAAQSAEEAKSAESEAKSALKSAEGIEELCQQTKQAAEQIAHSEETAAQAAITAQGYSVSAAAAENSARQAESNARNSEQQAYLMADIATGAADTVLSAVGENWQLYKEVVLEQASVAYSEQVENLGSTTKGLRIKMTLPAGKALNNNRITLHTSLNNSRQMAVRAENWFVSESPTVCYFDIKPFAQIWNVNVTPYTKYISSYEGDVFYSDGDKVRYIRIQTNDTNPIPVGTKFEIWGLV